MEARPESYSDAIAEIKRILAHIEDQSIDLDELVKNVERAAELLVMCRGRIQKAELNIKKVLDNLDELMQEGGRASAEE